MTATVVAGTLVPVGAFADLGSPTPTVPVVLLSPAGPSTHVVTRGDTLWSIARRYNVAVTDLVAANRITNADDVPVGSVLQIPARQAGGSQRSAAPVTTSTTSTVPVPSTAPASTTSVPAAGDRVLHTVQTGDTLWSLGKRYGVTVNAIVTANGLPNANRVPAGTVLVIPVASAPGTSVPTTTVPAAPGTTTPPTAPTTTVPVPAGGRTVSYRVRTSDTWERIADLFAVPVADVKAANPGMTVPAGTVTVPAAQYSLRQVAVAQRPMAGTLVHAADAAGLPRTLVMAVAYQESRWRSGVVSSAGALDVMQVMPATGAWVHRDLLGGKGPVDLRDPSTNARIGATYLRWLLDRFGWDVERATAAYYSGPNTGQITAGGRAYAASVARFERGFRV